MTDDMDRLGAWIAEHAPHGWREGHDDPDPADAAIRMLQTGADAWTQLLLVKRALIGAAVLTQDEVGGDVAERLPARLAEIPPYVWSLMDAYLTGGPLDFAGRPVPAPILRAIQGAIRDGDLAVSGAAS